MRWFLGFVMVCALLWGGIWVVGTHFLRQEAQNWIQQNSAKGGVVLSGFPNRVDLTLENLAIANPTMAYDAPILRFSTQSWWPLRIKATFANSQDIRFQDHPFTITSAVLTGAAQFDPFGDLPLGRLTLDGLVIDGTQIMIETPSNLRLGSQAVTIGLDGSADALLPRLNAQITSLIIPLAVSGLPAMIDALSLDANLHLQSPMDIAQRPPAILDVDIENVRLDWGDFKAEAKGQIAPDQLGRLSGNITLKMQGAQHLPNILRAMGLITPDQSIILAQGLRILGPSGQISLPVTIADGLMRIGPLPLGAAPNWRL